MQTHYNCYGQTKCAAVQQTTEGVTIKSIQLKNRHTASIYFSDLSINHNKNKISYPCALNNHYTM